jgi:hypothetical protein
MIGVALEKLLWDSKLGLGVIDRLEKHLWGIRYLQGRRGAGS